MKRLMLLTFLTGLAFSTAQAQSAKASSPTAATPDASKPVQLVEASCGQCKFGLPGKGCDLAVRVNGQAYFVDGTGIDSHGDAHAKDGFCNAVRQAKVQGDIVDNRFRATYFQLVPEPGKAK